MLEIEPVWHVLAAETVSNGSIFTISSQFRLFLQRAAVAPAASAEGASMAGRAPKARACSINKILYRVSEAKRRRKQTARAQRGSFALTRRGICQCSITRRGNMLHRASEASEDGSKRPERSEGRLRSPAGVPVFDHPQGYNTSSSERRRKQTARAQRGSFALTRS